MGNFEMHATDYFQQITETTALRDDQTKQLNDETKQLNDRTKQLDWILPVTVNLVLITATVGILISLIHYGIKAKKWRGNTRRNSTVLNSGRIYSCVVACGVFCLMRMIVSLVFMNIGFSETKLCDPLFDAAFYFYLGVLVSVAAFLWLRQRAFYVNQVLNVNYNSKIKFFSFSCVVIFAIYTVVVVVVGTPTITVFYSEKRCITNVSVEISTVYLPLGIIGGLLHQVILLGLLVYALTHVKTFQSLHGSKQNKISERIAHATISKSPRNSERYQENYNNGFAPTTADNFGRKADQKKGSATNIKDILLRTVIIAIVSVASELLLRVCIYFVVASQSSLRIASLIYDIIGFLNLALLVFSFTNYKEILKSPCTNTKTNSTLTL